MPFPAFLAAALPAFANLLGGLGGAGIQSLTNRRLMNAQNRYNSPAAQMERYRKAGLNPNLVYTQGTSGNWTTALPTNWQGALSNLGTQYVQSELTQTQSDVGQQKIDESKTKQVLMLAQRDVLAANPNLNKDYLNALVTNMVSTAKLKEQEANFMTSETSSTGATTQGEAKMMLDINALAERNNLMEADKKIKAEIIQSAKFKNELLEIQRDWLKNGDITPQHILNGIMLLLAKFM